MNKKVLAVAVSGVLAAPFAAQAVESSFYGHVNRAIMFGDDGVGSDVQFVDNSASVTRFGWRGEGDVGNGMKAGARIELNPSSNVSGSAGLKGGDFNAGSHTHTVGGTTSSSSGGGNVNTQMRHAFVYFSGNWGTLNLGHTSDAIDGVAFADLSNAWIPAENFPDVGGGITFRADNAAGTATSLTVASIFSSFDGGRRDGVRYDSPSFGPVSFMVGAATNNRWDASLWVDSELAGGQFWGAVGYSHAAGATGADTILASASYKFSQGTNVAVAWAQRDAPDGSAAGTPDPDHFFVALGHDWGNNAARVFYQQTDDVSAGCEGESFGVGFNHSIPKPRVDLYAGYANHSADCNAAANAGFGLAATTDLEDINVFFVGSRVRFD